VISPILLGVDIGTSDTKVLATTLGGQEITVAATRTRWTNRSGGRAETDPEALADSVIALMSRVAQDASDRVGAVVVAGASFTGMAEAGVLLDGRNRPAAPIIAWFDPRGGAEIAAAPEAFRVEFAARTGLPCNAMATVGKLLWMTAEGLTPRAGSWLNVPEFVAHRLGAQPATEWSLASRTGLLDQSTADLWPTALDLLGAGPGLIPPRVCAGTPLGRIGDAAAEILRGAVLTVAGHDHPVAAVGSGAVGPTDVFDSFGTAEAFVRAVDTEIAPPARSRLADLGITTGRHVLPGRRVLLAGSKAGLLLRRTLELLGSADPDGRERLDRAAMDRMTDADRSTGATVSGADNTDGVLRISVEGDGTGPADLWLAAIDHITAESERLLAAMAAEVGPSERTVIAGGWTRMSSIRRAKSASLPHVRYSDRSQAGAFGAALFAAHAVEAAAVLATAGRPDAVGIDEPSGPTQEFAAAFAARRMDASRAAGPSNSVTDRAGAAAPATIRTPEETRT
jgi:sugar (pentulose or hexulose) kinase